MKLAVDFDGTIIKLNNDYSSFVVCNNFYLIKDLLMNNPWSIVSRRPGDDKQRIKDFIISNLKRIEPRVVDNFMSIYTMPVGVNMTNTPKSLILKYLFDIFRKNNFNVYINDEYDLGLDIQKEFPNIQLIILPNRA